MSIRLVVFLGFVAASTAIGIRGLRPPTSGDVDRWIDRHDLDVGPDGCSLVRVYLSWIRPWRSFGSLVGLAPFLRWILYDSQDQAGPWPALWVGSGVVGYVAGCIIAEITFPAVLRAATGEAELKPRELRTFLSRSMTVVPWVLAALALGLLPAYLFVADPARVAFRLAGVIWASALVILTAVSVRVAANRIVDRPRPMPSGELLRVDQVQRASSLRTIVLGAIALELLLISFIVSEIGWAIQTRLQQMFGEPVSWLSAALVVLAVLAWFGAASDRTPSSLVRRAGT